MTDSSPKPDHIDAAYATAAEACADPSAARRRDALLEAVAAMSSEPDATEPEPAQRGSPRRKPAAWWGALAAAAVVGLSSVLVLQMAGDRGDSLPQPVSPAAQAQRPIEPAERPAEARSGEASKNIDTAKAAERRALSRSHAEVQQAEAVRPSTAGASPALTAADSAEPQQSAAAAGMPPAAPPVAKAGRAAGLIAAVDAGDVDAVKRQLALASADAERDREGRTALAHAVLASKPELVRLLLQAGADRMARDRSGQTPLDHAAVLGNAEVLEALRQR